MRYGVSFLTKHCLAKNLLEFHSTFERFMTQPARVAFMRFSHLSL